MQSRTTTSWYGALAIVIGPAVLFPAYVIDLLAPTALVAMSTAGIGAKTLPAHYEVAKALAEIFFSVGIILIINVLASLVFFASVSSALLSEGRATH